MSNNMMLLEERSDVTSTTSYFEEFVINESVFGNGIDFEKASFLKKKLELMHNPDYIGKYVAVIHGKVVDKDNDKYELLKRVYKNQGYVPMLIEKISDELEEHTTSPNFEL